MKAVLFVFPLILFAQLAFAQPTSADSLLLPGWLPKTKNFKWQTTLMVQLWGVYSTDMAIYNPTAAAYEAVDNRFNLSLRRARLVFNGTPYPRLSYSLALHYDQVGRDLLTSTVGNTNPDQPAVGVWDAFAQYQLKKGSQVWWLTAGYFRPQFQRESITSAWASTSFEKAMSQNYVRQHLVGTGPGRAAGLNLGGWWAAGPQWGLLYNLGVFNPLTTGFAGVSVGRRYAPLLSARLSVQLGDPEMNQYRLAYEVNHFNARRGLSLDLNLAQQGATDAFRQSTAAGPGMLFNWGPLNLDGEWMWLSRTGLRTLPDGGGERQFRYTSATGHLRLGYNLLVAQRRYILEPTLMVMNFRGALDATGQADALAVGAASGRETTYDAGLNWYLHGRNLKLYVHYTWRTGKPGDAGDGARVNAFFSQAGVGAIRRGNYWGIGMNGIF